MKDGAVLTIESADRKLTLVKENRYRVQHVSTKKVKHNARADELRGLREYAGCIWMVHLEGSL